MGKNASKHVHRSCDLSSSNEECFLVNAQLNKALEEQIWKKTTKTGYNLANYNMNQSLSELSIHLEDVKTETSEMNLSTASQDNSIPLKVDLPPIKTDNETNKVFVFDQEDDKKDDKDLKDSSKLNIEEFECGVHFGGGENAKQEWSFTLYDFDGHGKITKEDLVGLLKALYDAVGSSIKIPNNGTKTLKLRLSVGQEAGATSQGGGAIEQATPAHTDKGVANQESSSPKKKENTSTRNKENLKNKESPKSKVKEISRLNNLMLKKNNVTAKCNNETQQQQQQQQQQQEGAGSAGKSRLSVQKHKELANLVQENMERNHIKQLRRHHSDCRGCHQEHAHYKRRNRGPRHASATKEKNTNSQNAANKVMQQTPGTSAMTAADDMPKESQDRRNYYMDLAGVENTSSKFQSNTDTPPLAESALKTPANQGLNNSVNTSMKLQTAVKPQSALHTAPMCVPKHFRSRSHEFSDKLCAGSAKDTADWCHLQTDNFNIKTDHFRSRSFDPKDAQASTSARVMKGPAFQQGMSPQKQSRFRPVSLPAHIPETESPHYHRRHRNREKDHDLAMQQVAEWIEREHTLDIEADRIVIQRHEHHHVHEHHHHHHYHHYYEA